MRLIDRWPRSVVVDNIIRRERESERDAERERERGGKHMDVARETEE